MDNARFHAALRAAVFFQRTCRLRRLLIAHGADAFASSLVACPPPLIVETLARLPAGFGNQVRLALPNATRRRVRRMHPLPPTPSAPTATSRVRTAGSATGESA